jgi:hypothetical protein
MSYQLTVSNKKIYDFYTAHPNLNFEDMSLLMVEMLKKILKKPDNTLDSSLAEKLLGSMNLLDTRMKNMDKCMSEVFENKFAEFKQNYTQELNTLLNNTTNERAITVLKDYNETMQDKTKILFNDLFPKNNEFIANQINNTFNIFDKLINSTEARLQNTITDTKNTIESKLTSINTITNTQNVISENINHLINKFHGSSTKGMFSEVSVVEGLTRIYPYGNVDHIGNKISGSGDIILTRKEHSPIMIENKEYDRTVTPPEIQKFIDNAVRIQHDGIMLSQQSQIQNKDDFEININGDLIFVYICNMGYNIDKVRTAISIIDYLKSQIAFINKDKVNVSLTKDEIDSINQEYNSVLAHKKFIIKMLNDSHIKIIKEVESIRVPTMEYILTKEYGIKLSDEEDCKWCGKPCKNHAGVSNHLKTCQKYLESEQYTIDEENKKAQLQKKTQQRTRKPKNGSVLDIQ